MARRPSSALVVLLGAMILVVLGVAGVTTVRRTGSERAGPTGTDSGTTTTSPDLGGVAPGPPTTLPPTTVPVPTTMAPATSTTTTVPASGRRAATGGAATTGRPRSAGPAGTSARPPAPAPKVLFQLGGPGYRFHPFVLPSGGRLAWSYDCSGLGRPATFLLEVDGPGGLVHVDQTGMGGSGGQRFQPGNYVLQAASECSWSVTVTAS